MRDSFHGAHSTVALGVPRAACASGTPASPARSGRQRMIRQKSARMVAHLSEIVLGLPAGHLPEFILCVRFDIRHHPRPRRLRARVRGGTRSAHAAFATNCSDDLKGIRGGHVSRPQSLVSPDDTLRSKSRDSGRWPKANASANCPGSTRPARVTHTLHRLSSLVRSEHRLAGPPSHRCGPALHSWNGACPVPAASGRLLASHAALCGVPHARTVPGQIEREINGPIVLVIDVIESSVCSSPSLLLSTCSSRDRTRR